MINSFAGLKIWLYISCDIIYYLYSFIIFLICYIIMNYLAPTLVPVKSALFYREFRYIPANMGVPKIVNKLCIV